MEPGNPKAVKELFNAIAPSYDRLNDLFSFGLHRLWKRQLIASLTPSPGEHWVDLCCGTGDLALLLSKEVGPSGSVLGLDCSGQSLVLAQKRSLKMPWLNLKWIEADLFDNGLPSNSFEGVAMAYGLRNLHDPFEGLVEIRRLLKPGARAGVLDFQSGQESKFGNRFQTFYLRQFVVPLASKLGFKDHYAYIEKSLKLFPNGPSLVKMSIEAGFSSASYHPFAFGQMGTLLLHA